MYVTLGAVTENAEAICAYSARTCYSDLPVQEIEMTEEEAARVLRRCIKHGHTSVLEHANFTFGISGISRACSHQLVRHRLASYSQQSQRYVSENDALVRPYVTPKSICQDSVLQDAYDGLMVEVWNLYFRLLANDVPSEDARFVLPNAAMTNICMTMNARELRHFFALRTCSRAQWEIRELADRMLFLVKTATPLLFEGAGANCKNCREGGCDLPTNL